MTPIAFHDDAFILSLASTLIRSIHACLAKRCPNTRSKHKQQHRMHFDQSRSMFVTNPSSPPSTARPALPDVTPYVCSFLNPKKREKLPPTLFSFEISAPFSAVQKSRTLVAPATTAATGQELANPARTDLSAFSVRDALERQARFLMPNTHKFQRGLRKQTFFV